MDAQQRKNSVAWLSVISNASLVLGKLVIGILIGSVSVVSEAIHSGVDFLAAVIALFAVKTSNKVADDEHPFGHGKVENISGTVEALLIFLAADGSSTRRRIGCWFPRPSRPWAGASASCWSPPW